MSKRMLYLMVLACLPMSWLLAQNGSKQELMKVVPPSPTVASLGKFGDVPVGLYTGIPDISIPLYMARSGSLELPVTLSYHAGGIKVEEIASPVGIGWALQAGGVIGRNVRGLADEISSWANAPQGQSVEDVFASANNTKINQLVEAVDRGDRDGEADIYYYNVNQASGKFFFDQRGNLHTVPAKNIKIDRVVHGWQMAVEDGTVYTFTKVEVVSSSACSGDGTVDAAWFLTEIRSADGKRFMTFTYDPVNYTFETLLGQTKYFWLNGTGNGCMQNPTSCLGTQNYNTHRLARIDFEGGYVQFDYTRARCDVMGDKSLDAVKVFTTDKQLIKSYAFAYGYFGDDNSCSFLTKNAKRLKLLSVTEGGQNLQKPPYLFQYNESVALPGRLSYAQDHWGYFNGKVNNPGLVPTSAIRLHSGALITVDGADRNTNPETAQAGVMTKIVYPTGGSTTFDYESNTVSDGQIPVLQPTREESMILVNGNDALNKLPSPFESNTIVIPAGGAEVEFQVSGFPALLWSECDYVQCSVVKDDNPVPFVIFGDSWNGVKAHWGPGTYKIRLNTYCSMDVRASFRIAITAKIPMATQQGDYRTVGGLRIRATTDDPGDGGAPVIKRYRYHQANDSVHSSGMLVNFAEYEYLLNVKVVERIDGGSPGNAPTLCSYVVRQSFSNYPLATTQGSYVGYQHVIVDYGEQGQSWNTYSMHPDLKANYPYAPHDNMDWTRGFLLNRKDYRISNGRLTLAKEVINRPTGFNRVSVLGIKTGRNEMVIDGGQVRPEVQAPAMSAFYSTISEVFAPGQTKERLYDQDDTAKYIETVTDYRYSPQHLQLTETVSLTGAPSAQTVEEVVSHRKYPGDYHFSGAPVGAAATGIKKLQDLHMVNAVVEEYVVKRKRNTVSLVLSDQRVVGGGITVYRSDRPYPDRLLKLEAAAPLDLASFGAGSGIVANQFVPNLNPAIGNLYQPAIVFNRYDDMGNVLTQQKANDVKQTYIWGYGHQYPVAEVVGADYETVMSAAGLNRALIQDFATSDAAMRQELDKIRQALPGAMVKSYSYKPLVGVVSETDANNRSQFYDYDGLGRLVLVRDHDLNILKKFCYNYQGQTQSCVLNVSNPK